MTGILPSAFEPNASSSAITEFLRIVEPEIKLALGAAIDRENTKPLSAEWSVVPTTLHIFLRPDLAATVEPVYRRLEASFAESCRRHGLLYNRGYSAQVWSAIRDDAPAFEIVAQMGRAVSPDDLSFSAGRSQATQFESSIPRVDSDATLSDTSGPEDWDPSQWLLRVKMSAAKDEPQAYPLTESRCVIGRRAQESSLHANILLEAAPRTISRRQLAIVWEPRSGNPGFKVYNVGLAPLNIGDEELPGMNLDSQAFAWETLPELNSRWTQPEERFAIGRGLTLWIERNALEWEADPDATIT
ncbi:MAG: hypothetical protein WEE89_15850 [Gemmatimonadota bacterium]